MERLGLLSIIIQYSSLNFFTWQLGSKRGSAHQASTCFLLADALLAEAGCALSAQSLWEGIPQGVEYQEAWLLGGHQCNHVCIVPFGSRSEAGCRQEEGPKKGFVMGSRTRGVQDTLEKCI